MKNFLVHTDEVKQEMFESIGVAGIEDENSTLLEQDEYKDPESAVIDVDSTEMGKAAAEIEAEEIQEGEK